MAGARLLGERAADGEGADGAAHGERLARRERPAHRCQGRELVDHLAGEPGVHVVDVGDAEEAPDGAGDEGRLFDRVQEVVTVLARQGEAAGEQQGVVDQLLPGEPRAQVAQPGEGGEAVDAAGKTGVRPLGEGEDVDLVAVRGQHLDEHLLGDRRAARLEERVRREQQDLHRATTSRATTGRAERRAPLSA